MQDYNKVDLKSIENVNKQLNTIFKSVDLLVDGWVVGEPTLDIGKHCARVHDTLNGFCKHNEKGTIRIVPSETSTNLKALKKNVRSLLVNNDLLELIVDVAGSLEARQLAELRTPLDNSDERLTDMASILDKTSNNDALVLPSELVKTIAKNEYFTTLHHGGIDLRVSKQLMPGLRSVKDYTSIVHVYVIHKQDRLYQVIFKVINEHVTSYHMYICLDTK